MKRLILFASIIAIGATSCKKETIVEPEQSKLPWALLVDVAIDILADNLKGDYNETNTYYPDGTLASKNIWCDGIIGCCCINASTTDGTNLNTLSSAFTYQQNFDYSINAELIKTQDGRVVFAINHAQYPSQADEFFYDDTILISGALTINNPTILNTLKENNTLIVQGEYEVFESTDNNCSYIVIKS